MGMGMRIRELRTHKGWSQHELARRCGWASRNRVHQYEREIREPRGRDIERLAKTLGVSPAWLRFGQEDSPALDASTLEQILALIDGVNLPIDKRAKLVAVLYQDAQKGIPPDRDRVQALLRLLT